jgi:plasmid stabilization system protein ParE
MTPIIYSAEALEDVQKILVYLEEQEPRLVAKFESDYRRALEGIRQFPHACPKVGRSVRVKVVSKRFRYGIYYQLFKKTIFIGASSI